MSRVTYASCRGPLSGGDRHIHCASGLGRGHAKAALSKAKYDEMPLSTMRPPRQVSFKDNDPVPPLNLCSGRAHGGYQSGRIQVSSRRPSSRVPHPGNPPNVNLSSSQRQTSAPLIEQSVSTFLRDQRKRTKSLSLAASECKLTDSRVDPAPSTQACTSDARLRFDADAELLRVLTKAAKDLELEWSSPEPPKRSRLDGRFLQQRWQAPRQRPAPFFPEVHDELTKSWKAPNSTRLKPSISSMLSTVDGAAEKGYKTIPPLEEAVAAHLCPPTARRWKVKPTHPSKPSRATSALAGRAYASAGQAASALHTMAVVQVFQAKQLSSMDKSGPQPEALRDLRIATDVALRAIKSTAQAIGKSMAYLTVLERHLWLNLTEMKHADREAFLNSPISTTSLFGLAAEDLRDVAPKKAPYSQ